MAKTRGGYHQAKRPNKLIVFDFETGGKDPCTCEPIELAAKVYDPFTLEPIPTEQGGEFHSTMKPVYMDRLEDGALKVNKRTREEIETFPDSGVVWRNFVDWVKRFNPGNSDFTAPFACGYNIKGFDLIIVDRMNKQYAEKGSDTVLFARMPVLDVLDDMYRWFRRDNSWERLNLDTARGKLGYDAEGAHGALNDVRVIGHLMVRFLRLYKGLGEARTTEGGLLVPWDRWKQNKGESLA